jgi:protein-S-isoprenylcysteine O-methyltransferase Ste14
MKPDYLVFLLLYLVGLSVRHGYERLKESGRVNSKNRAVFFYVFAAMCMMWAGWFEMCPLDPFHLIFPAGVRWTAFAAVLLGFVLAVGSFLQLRGVENIDRLVMSGLYSKVRHPMYTGFILWVSGWVVYHGAVASLLPGIAGILSILHWQRLEEKSLESRYGEAYGQYRTRTWF